MAITLNQVIEAFNLLFVSIQDRKFSKTLRLHHYTESELLPLVRTFLLGYFGESLVAEAAASLPGSISGRGRLDFVIGNVAVELAVRERNARREKVSLSTNSPELKKLMKHPGLAVLVLFDFSRTPYSEEKIESFRNWPSLGQGNHKKSAFNVAYFYIESFRPLRTACLRKNVRVH